MADNYLEVRMEELRKGKLSIKAKPGIKPRSRRILIAASTKGAPLDKALQYRKEGHRVAIFDEDEAAGRRLAHDHGIRFTRVSLHDEASLTRELHSLLKAWRGLDTLIASEGLSCVIARTISDWKENLPIPDKSSLEIVITNKRDHI